MYAYNITMMCLFLCSVSTFVSSVIFPKRRTDNTEHDHNVVAFNYLQSVIATWRKREERKF
jgi:hypothetical protein